jgi:lysophospholipase L1-like esterase
MINSVCIFGDSVAKGVVLDSVSKKYVLLKDSFANRLNAGAHFGVKNYSRFGSTVTRGQEMLSKRLGELKNYDYVALEFGGNDCDYDWAKIAAEPDAEHRPNTPVGAFVQKYTQMIREVKAAGSQPVLLSLPPIDARRYFAWVSRGLNARNILHWLGDVERIYRWHEMYNVAVFRLADDTHTPLIDISSAFLETHGYQKLICDDGIHPNALGHELIARTIGNAVSQYRALAAG